MQDTPTLAEVTFHRQSHRLYRTLRRRVARELGEQDPNFAETVARLFREKTRELRFPHAA